MKEKWPNSQTNKYVPQCEEFFHFNQIIWLDPCATTQAAHKSEYQGAFQANANKERKKEKQFDTYCNTEMLVLSASHAHILCAWLLMILLLSCIMVAYQ